MATIEEIEARRTARREANEKARLEQLAIDLEALDALEAQHGDGRVGRIDLPAFVPGLPVFVVVTCPAEDVHRRYRAMMRAGVNDKRKQLEAFDMLGASCLGYPDKAKFSEVVAKFGGIPDGVGLLASKLADGRSADEGKG